MKTFPLILITAALFSLSCGTGNGHEQAASAPAAASVPAAARPAYDNSLPKGKITDSVSCIAQSAQSYALYLPSYYTPDKPFPCVFFFDAHARGVLPVKLYKDLAEKYGFVFVSSDISKNGMQWEETNAIVKTMTDDSRARINIDPKRIYTAGFSGGARVAGSVAILDGGVAGVIGCAAGFPNTGQAMQNKFDYFGMVGDFDFNLSEMEQLDQSLQQNGFNHQLLTFEGKHDWPAAADFQTAMLWQQVNAMKEGIQAKNDMLIAAFKNDFGKRIAAATSSGDELTAYALLDGITRTMTGLAGAAEYKKQLADLGSSKKYTGAIALQAALQQQEASQQKELQQQFTTLDVASWAKKISALKQSIHSAKTKQESQMDQRLLNVLGLVAYLNTSHAISTSDLENAANYLKIFKMADPSNPDISYLTAQYWMKKGDTKQAIAELNEAAKHGYSETATLISDPVFGSLQGDAGFMDVVKKVRANTEK